MRPVDQVVSDLKKAEEEANRAQMVVAKFRAELEGIHVAVQDALGIKKQVYRNPQTQVSGSTFP